MGSHISRAKRRSSTTVRYRSSPTTAEPPVLSAYHFNPSAKGRTDGDLSSCAATCRTDSPIRSINSARCENTRTSRAINPLVVPDVSLLSLDSLSQVTECLVDMNEDVVNIILQNKGILKNKDLSDLVNRYLESSLLAQDFCNFLDSCIQRAGEIEPIVNAALRKFKREHSALCQQVSVKYAATLEELRNFTKVGDPFTEDFNKRLNSVFSRQVVMMEELPAKKKKLHNKLARLKAYRRISKVIFIVAFASVLICPVVAAVVAVPPVVAAAAAAALPLTSLWKWLDSTWKKREMNLMWQKEILCSMQIESYIVLKDLGNIQVQVETFQIGIAPLLLNAHISTTTGVEEAGVVAAIGEIKKEARQFLTITHELRDRADQCTQQIGMARTLMLRRFINHPSTSN